jgi:16S rRNA (cytosine967-C5)-methyltransferase
MAEAITSRRIAHTVLVEVDAGDAYANLVLPKLLQKARLSVRDRAFATELAYGTLRAQGTLDHVLEPHLNRPLPDLDPEVRAALRLGTYQLWRTRVPSYAAVGQTVSLVPARARGFVNAVLRAVGAAIDGPDPLRLQALSDPLDRLALSTAHPSWIVDAYLAALGGDVDETEVALTADDARPTVHLAAIPGRITAAELAVESGGRIGAFSPYAVYLDEGGDPGALASIRSGAARAQDEGSQLCALALVRALNDIGTDAGGQSGSRPGALLDLAAGPGGKAALLAALVTDRLLVASDVRPHRARLVRSGGVPGVVVADGRRAPYAPGAASAVLLDAPCTGLGALRRRPEARWRRKPEDVAGLVALQRELLVAALDLVRPGGVVAYVVCSPHLAEAVVPAEILETVDVLDAPAALGLGADARAPDTGGLRLQLWPHRHGTDAMSATLLRRR